MHRVVTDNVVGILDRTFTRKGAEALVETLRKRGLDVNGATSPIEYRIERTGQWPLRWKLVAYQAKLEFDHPGEAAELSLDLKRSVEIANDLVAHKDDPDFMQRAKQEMLPAMREVTKHLPGRDGDGS